MENNTLIKKELPCFEYILGNIKDNDIVTLAAFSLAYISYLEKINVTDFSSIERALHKCTLLSQINFVSRKKPLDLLQLNGKKYTLKSDDDVYYYKKDLLDICKEPLSFSELYKKTDPQLLICNMCPMSEHYTLSDISKELALAKYALSSQAHFRKVVTCMDDVDRLFLSYTDLYYVLNNLSKPIAIPLLHTLFSSIFIKVNDFFNPFLEGEPYNIISKDFDKRLNFLGVSKQVKDIEPNFSENIFNYIYQLIHDAEDLTDITSTSFKQELFTRGSYAPFIDADAIPSIKLEKAIPTNNVKTTEVSETSKVSLDTSNAELALLKTQKKKRKKKRPIDSQDIPAPVSLEFDIAMSREINDNPTLIEDNVSKQEPVFEDMPDGIADVLSSDGEVLVEHTIATASEDLEYDDGEDFDFDEYEKDISFYDDEFIDEIPEIDLKNFSSDEVDINGESSIDSVEENNNIDSVLSEEDIPDAIVFDISSNEVTDTTLIEKAQDFEHTNDIPFIPEGTAVLDSVVSNEEDVFLSEESISEIFEEEIENNIQEMIQEEEMIDSETPIYPIEPLHGNSEINTEGDLDITISGVEDESLSSEEKFLHELTPDTLTKPISISKDELSSFTEIIYENQVDSVLDQISIMGYTIMEPCILSDNNSSISYLCIKAQKDDYFIKLESPLLKSIFSRLKLRLFCSHTLVLYQCIYKAAIPINKKELIIPIDVPAFDEHITFRSLKDYITRLDSFVSDTYILEGALTLPDELETNTLLYSAYGSSFDLSRFFGEHMMGSTYYYKEENGGISLFYNKFEINSEKSVIPGVLYEFSFSTNSKDKNSESGFYSSIIRSTILELCKKSCFVKFKLALVGEELCKFSIYSETYSESYISNFVLMTLFKEGTKLGVKPLDIIVKKHILGEKKK